MFSFLASYSFRTWPTTSYESLQAFRCCTRGSLDILRPMIMILYSASLLIKGNPKRRAYWMTSPSRLVRISPTLDPLVFEDPSTCIIHWFSRSFACSLFSDSSSGMVHFVTKSTSTHAFMVGRGQNQIQRARGPIWPPCSMYPIHAGPSWVVDSWEWS